MDAEGGPGGASITGLGCPESGIEGGGGGEENEKENENEERGWD
jgi:hypothetical protein